jgi:TPR repeat protein
MTGAALRAIALSAIAGALGAAGCGRHAPTEASDTPAPSASVLTLGVGLGACSDVQACENECDAGSADRCRRLGASYAFGRGLPKDEVRATALYERACDLADPSACVFAGQMREYAHGVPEDVAAAAHLYDRACAMHWLAGCYNLAIVLDRGHGVPQDLTRAAALYASACAGGAKEACARAAELRDAGAVASDAGADR